MEVLYCQYLFAKNWTVSSIINRSLYLQGLKVTKSYRLYFFMQVEEED